FRGDKNLAIGLAGEAVYGPQPGGRKTRIYCSVVMEPPEIAPGLAGQRREKPAHQDQAIVLHRHTRWRAAARRSKCGVDRIIGIYSAQAGVRLWAQRRKGASDQSSFSGLPRKSIHPRIGVPTEVGIQRAIRIEASQI